MTDTDKLIADAREYITNDSIGAMKNQIMRDLCDTIERQQKEIEALRGFGRAVMTDFPEIGCLDGGDIQDLAFKHGLLEKVQRNEPCGDHCSCADFGSDFPTDCYVTTALLNLKRQLDMESSDER